jgi:hypothetical protein
MRLRMDGYAHRDLASGLLQKGVPVGPKNSKEPVESSQLQLMTSHLVSSESYESLSCEIKPFNLFFRDLKPRARGGAPLPERATIEGRMGVFLRIDNVAAQTD